MELESAAKNDIRFIRYPFSFNNYRYIDMVIDKLESAGFIVKISNSSAQNDAKDKIVVSF